MLVKLAAWTAPTIASRSSWNRILRRDLPTCPSETRFGNRSRSQDSAVATTDVFLYWRNQTKTRSATMLGNTCIPNTNRKHFLNAIVALKLVKVILHTIFDNERREKGTANFHMGGGGGGESGEALNGDTVTLLQTFVVLKLAKLFFYGFVWAPLTVYFGGLGSLHRFQWGVGSVDSRNGPLKGKKGYTAREVSDESNPFLYNVYFRVLRLPLPLFLLCWFSTYAMVNVLFACLYYLDVDGFHVEKKTSWPTWIEGMVTKHVTSWLTVLLYSSSILTNFSGAGADAHSPYTHMLGNAHAMLAQFVSLFWFSACFKRISKPLNAIRWSSVAVVNHGKTAIAMAGSRTLNAKNPPALTIRFDVVRPYSAGLIDAKFDAVCVKADGLQSPLQPGMQLSLTQQEATNLTHGAVLQHVIDDKSPLFLLDLETLRNRDVIFNVSVRAMEKSTMKQIFSERLYSAHDNDILWDCAFQEQTYVDGNGNAVYDYTRLNKLRSHAGSGSSEE